MTGRRFGAVRHELGEVDTTQAVARDLADAGATEGTVVVAEHQRAGRGRSGRSWLDRPGENLLLSLILRPTIRAAEVPQLALLAAVGVAEAIEQVTGLGPAIKWPNDLLLVGRKCAGILAEAASDGAIVTRAILGVGINVNQREFPVELADGATSLALVLGWPVDRRALLAAVLARLEHWYEILRDDGFKPIHPEWCRRSVTLGREVAAGEIRGTAIALDHDGALVVRLPSGVTGRLVAGEVRDAARH
jgi:BirA family biotin operon repressor/biotin-[acetyl-CoA-carboxylase] ligase